ncbi:MAG: phosphotransferase [Myxococcota bacterium]|nr:phosphotransferase [Myxococcota bacterium]
MTAGSDREQMQPHLERALARHLGGQTRLVEFERLTSGASQETYRVVVEAEGGQRVLALRRAAGGRWTGEAVEPGRAGIRTEAELIRQAARVGVPEPEVVGILEERDGLGDGFLMEWLEGETLGARIVKSEALAEIRPRLARQCGEILARIHSIDLEESGLASQLTTVTPAEYVEQTWAAYRMMGTPQPMIDYTARWLIENLPENPRTTLVHNDFRNGNVMVSPDGIVAVLDWELAHVGDPIRDIGWICTNSWRFGRRDQPVGGFGQLEDLLAGYASVSGIQVDLNHIRFWEVFGSFWWSIGCLGMAQQFRNGPDRSIERATIGRRSSECQVDCVNLLIPGSVELVEGDTDAPDLDLPRVDELLHGVRDLLREDLMTSVGGRLSFMSRVSANAIDIALRELEVGREQKILERGRLVDLLGEESDLESLRWKLVEKLRAGRMSLDHPNLAGHLRTTVVNQVAIDQPRYSGFLAAIGSTQ